MPFSKEDRRSGGKDEASKMSLSFTGDRLERLVRPLFLPVALPKFDARVEEGQGPEGLLSGEGWVAEEG